MDRKRRKEKSRRKQNEEKMHQQTMNLPTNNNDCHDATNHFPKKTMWTSLPNTWHKNRQTLQKRRMRTITIVIRRRIKWSSSSYFQRWHLQRKIKNSHLWRATGKIQKCKKELSGHINYNHSESGVCGANEYELNTYVW